MYSLLPTVNCPLPLPYSLFPIAHSESSTRRTRVGSPRKLAEGKPDTGRCWPKPMWILIIKRNRMEPVGNQLAIDMIDIDHSNRV